MTGPWFDTSVARRSRGGPGGKRRKRDAHAIRESSSAREGERAREPASVEASQRWRAGRPSGLRRRQE